MNTIEEWAAEYSQKAVGFDEFCDQLQVIRNEAFDATIEAIEIFAAEIWDNKYEPDKMHCVIESWFKMGGDDLLRKHRDNIYKRPTAIEDIKNNQ